MLSVILTLSKKIVPKNLREVFRFLQDVVSSGMMDYEYETVQRMGSDRTDATISLTAPIPAIHGSLPELDHRWHGFQAAQPRLLWRPSRTGSNPVQPVAPGQTQSNQSHQVKPSPTSRTRSNPVQPVPPGQTQSNQSHTGSNPVRPVALGQTSRHYSQGANFSHSIWVADMFRLAYEGG